MWNVQYTCMLETIIGSKIYIIFVTDMSFDSRMITEEFFEHSKKFVSEAESVSEKRMLLS